MYGVPVMLHRRPIGALTLDCRQRTDRDHERMLKFLREAERRRLVDENTQLRQESN